MTKISFCWSCIAYHFFVNSLPLSSLVIVKNTKRVKQILILGQSLQKYTATSNNFGKFLRIIFGIQSVHIYLYSFRDDRVTCKHGKRVSFCYMQGPLPVWYWIRNVLYIYLQMIKQIHYIHKLTIMNLNNVQLLIACYNKLFLTIHLQIYNCSSSYTCLYTTGTNLYKYNFCSGSGTHLSFWNNYVHYKRVQYGTTL